MSPSNPAELFFQKVDVYEDIRDGVFIHHRDIPPRQEILCGRQRCNRNRKQKNTIRQSAM
jgi:hypothetical protein